MSPVPLNSAGDPSSCWERNNWELEVGMAPSPFPHPVDPGWCGLGWNSWAALAKLSQVGTFCVALFSNPDSC